MTSSDRPAPESESAGPDEPPPTAREPQCRIIYRTPETLTIGDANTTLANTMAVLSFAATKADIPAEQLPSLRIIGPDFLEWVPIWRFRGTKPSSTDWLASITPIRRLHYASPLEVFLSAPQGYVAAGIALLWAIPSIVARFSRLRARLARDRLDRDVYDALRERVRSDDVLADLEDQAFDGLFRIDRAITQDEDQTIDSETVPTEIDEYLEFLDEHGIEEDQGFGEGPEPPDSP
jgi:hypothetical protein